MRVSSLAAGLGGLKAPVDLQCPMDRYFTHYWDDRTWEQYRANHEGLSLDRVMGNQFFKKGVAIGDMVFVVHVRTGQMYLAGRMEVGERHREEGESWVEVLTAEEGSGTALSFRRKVPLDIVKDLRFRGGDIARPLLFKSNNRLDSQTLRGVRELTPASAALLDTLLDAGS